MDRVETLLMSSERPCHDSVSSASAKRRLTEYKVKIISLFKRKRMTKVFVRLLIVDGKHIPCASSEGVFMSFSP